MRESADRVRVALLHRGFDFPNPRLPVNLAPADRQPLAAATLVDACAHLRGESTLERIAHAVPKSSTTQPPDFGDVEGPLLAKRALEVAAAGGHPVLMA